MSENMKKLLAEAGKNEELKAKLEALTDRDTAVEKAIEIAKEYGFDLTEEDFKAEDGEELSIDEAETVAGGDFCPCVSSTESGDDCFCVFVGAFKGFGCVAVGFGR